MSVDRQPRARLEMVGEALVAFSILLLICALALAGLERLGTVGLLLPFGIVAAALLVRHPTFTTFLAVGAAIFAESASFGALGVAARLYTDLGSGVMPLDLLFVLAVVGTALRVQRQGRPMILPPRSLTFAIALLVLALASGAVVGRDAGVSPTTLVLSIHTLAYLVVVPLLIVNLGLDRAMARRVLIGAGVLGLVKGLLGLLVYATGQGMAIDGDVLTYYEPVANWLTMLVALVVVAALMLRAQPPAWLLGALPFVLGSLVLSYRRSFWIGCALALGVLVLLGLSRLGRRLLVPILALVVAAVWLLGSVVVQSDSPLAMRLQSLDPNRVTTKAEDRYRLDERANVLGELRDHPITGLGLEVPWRATERSLPVEVNAPRTYVHFTALYWWLKLGVLGLLAFVALMASALELSWRVWRRAREPMLRAVGLGSLTGVIGLLVIETTASFTGVDLRFTLAFAAQLGLLAVLVRQLPPSVPPADDAPPVTVPPPGTSAPRA